MKSRYKVPTQISEILDKILKRKCLAKKIKQYEVVSRWQEIAGETLSKHSTPLKIQGDILIVSVKGSVWMNELKFLKPNLLAKIQETNPPSEIKDIRFVSGGVRYSRSPERS